MGSSLKAIEYISDQAGFGAALTHKKMFGEFALYLDGKVVGFVCDDQLYVKPTEAGRQVLGSPAEAPPYPGAKNHFLLQDELEDRDLLRAVLRATERALPMPKPKAVKRAKPGPAKGS